MLPSRRAFLHLSAFGSAAWLLPHTATAKRLSTTQYDYAPIPTRYADNELLTAAYDLLHQWGKGLLALQVKEKLSPGLQGGILCPACASIHGRSGDAIFPLLLLADTTKDPQYLDAALQLYDWMETTVSLPDGAWVNEINSSDWKGITVFGTIALAESLRHFGHLLTPVVKQRWTLRLRAAAQYLYQNFTVHTGNINYPISAGYALSLAGLYLQEEAFTQRGKTLAQETLAYLTPHDKLIYGEGHPTAVVSPKGCYSADLGYNVEESLPAWVLYGKLTNDTKVLAAATTSLQAHMEFMLPDGGWDNSWGVRSYKWTWWGSRTSDGCQPAYALMADADPAFYKVALQNTRLMQACTHDNLLHGGPHNHEHEVLPCVHHTFSHSKALATLLVHADAIKAPAAPQTLPREKDYGIKAFPDVGTWLFAQHGWKGTITCYDHNYSMKAGHPSGGALSLLWHDKTGALMAASMTRYQMVEAFNMQRDKSAVPTCLTPRLEAIVNGKTYTNLLDMSAAVNAATMAGDIIFTTQSQLVNEEGASPGTTATATITYRAATDGFHIQVIPPATIPDAQLSYQLPLVCRTSERVTILSDASLRITKAGATVQVTANKPFTVTGTAGERLFNFVPGMEMIALRFQQPAGEIQITVTITDVKSI